MYVEGTKLNGCRILLPVDSIIVIEEVKDYSSGFFLKVTVRDLKIHPIELNRGRLIEYDEIEAIELSDDFHAFTFQYKIAKGITNETPKEHKETKQAT